MALLVFVGGYVWNVPPPHMEGVGRGVGVMANVFLSASLVMCCMHSAHVLKVIVLFSNVSGHCARRAMQDWCSIPNSITGFQPPRVCYSMVTLATDRLRLLFQNTIIYWVIHSAAEMVHTVTKMAQIELFF